MLVFPVVPGQEGEVVLWNDVTKLTLGWVSNIIYFFIFHLGQTAMAQNRRCRDDEIAQLSALGSYPLVYSGFIYT